MVCSRLNKVCGDSCIRNAARLGRRERALQRRRAQLRVAQALIERKTHHEREREAISQQERGGGGEPHGHVV